MSFSVLTFGKRTLTYVAVLCALLATLRLRAGNRVGHQDDRRVPVAMIGTFALGRILDDRDARAERKADPAGLRIDGGHRNSRQLDQGRGVNFRLRFGDKGAYGEPG